MNVRNTAFVSENAPGRNCIVTFLLRKRSIIGAQRKCEDYQRGKLHCVDDKASVCERYLEI